MPQNQLGRCGAVRGANRDDERLKRMGRNMGDGVTVTSALRNEVAAENTRELRARCYAQTELRQQSVGVQHY